MKIIKIFHDGKRIGSIQKMGFISRMEIRLKRFLILTAKVCAIAWIVVGSVKYMQTYHPKVVFAEKEVVVEVESDAPVMSRIAKCESGGKHISPSGQVVVNVNSNGSYDTGLYQINSIWNKKATELGYDLYKESDNKAFAMYLYKTHGSEPWYSSKSCWNK